MFTKEQAAKMYAEELNKAISKFPEKREMLNLYRFDITKRKSILGICNYSKRVISLSTVCLMQTEDRLRNTLKHEIAHALYPKSGHGWEWRNCFISLGGDGERTTSRECLNNLDSIYRWKVIHSDTKEVVAQYISKPRRDFSKCIYKKDMKTLGKLILVAA